MRKIDLIVTRHPALIGLLGELGYDVEETPIVAHVSPEDLKGKVVAGVLPLSLASLTEAVVSVDLRLRPEDRGKELSLSDLRDRFVGVSIYKVEKIG